MNHGPITSDKPPSPKTNTIFWEAPWKLPPLGNHPLNLQALQPAGPRIGRFLEGLWGNVQTPCPTGFVWSQSCWLHCRWKRSRTLGYILYCPSYGNQIASYPPYPLPKWFHQIPNLGCWEARLVHRSQMSQGPVGRGNFWYLPPLFIIKSLRQRTK